MTLNKEGLNHVHACMYMYGFKKNQTLHCHKLLTESPPTLEVATSFLILPL
jgi:hypothetical protein